jgi:hypothetical protein
MRTPESMIVEGAPLPHVAGIAMFDSDDEAEEALRLLDTCPVLDHATDTRTCISTTLNGLYDANALVTLQRYAWAGDGLWTDGSADEVVPLFTELCLDVPSNASYGFFYPWTVQKIPNSALSITGKFYLAAFAAWTPPDDDTPYRAWVRDQIERLAPLSKGIQLADENLLDRPARYMTEEAHAKLEATRAAYDPDGLFYSYFYGEADAPGPV